MHRSRAPSIAPGTFFVAQSWADCITNMAGFNLRQAQVWLATDCDREGQLIGQEILEHYKYRGEVMRVLFTAQDSQTIRDSFGQAKPIAEYARLYAAAVARRQADQVYNLSLTRTATVILGRGTRRVIGVGRVKTPTLAICVSRLAWL
jgi:DNA topoisomerase III